MPGTAPNSRSLDSRLAHESSTAIYRGEPLASGQDRERESYGPGVGPAVGGQWPGPLDALCRPFSAPTVLWRRCTNLSLTKKITVMEQFARANCNTVAASWLWWRRTNKIWHK